MKNPLKDILISLFFLYLFVQTYDICFDYYKKISFISQYESDDFSRFRGVSMMLRGTDSADNYVIYGEKELYHNVCSIPFTIVVDQRTLLIVNLDSSQKERLDSIEFQQLIYSFFKYDIPRIDVDLNDNVYIYIKDFETLAMVRFTNGIEFTHEATEREWKKIKGNWYK